MNGRRDCSLEESGNLGTARNETSEVDSSQSGVKEDKEA